MECIGYAEELIVCFRDSVLFLVVLACSFGVKSKQYFGYSDFEWNTQDVDNLFNHRPIL